MKSDRCTDEYVKAVHDVAATFERMELTGKMGELVSVIRAAADADPKKPYDAAEMESARGRMRQFIATRPDEVRSSLRNFQKKEAPAGQAHRVQLSPPWLTTRRAVLSLLSSISARTPAV
jgi:hypothetical protein